MRTVSLGKPLIHLTSVDSTNKYAAEILHKEYPTEGTVILADVQTHGRGQGENIWFSGKGLNLLCSIILRPEFLPAYKQFYLSMSVASGIIDCLAGLEIQAQVKWPNDIIIKGRKVSGMLIENSVLSQNLHTSIVGIGLNVNQADFPAGIPDPASILGETGKSYDVRQILQTLLFSLEKRLNQLYAEDFIAVKSEYLNRLWLLNSHAVFSDQSGNFEGRVADVAESGELIILTSTGETRAYNFREVEFPAFK